MTISERLRDVLHLDDRIERIRDLLLEPAVLAASLPEHCETFGNKAALDKAILRAEKLVEFLRAAKGGDELP